MIKENIIIKRGKTSTRTHVVKVTFDNDDEWKEHRKDGIGGSEVGTLLGFNKYQTPLEWYRLKKGLEPEPETNENMMRGHFLEDGVAQYFSYLTGLTILKCTAPNIVYYDERFPYRRVTPDRFGLLGGQKSTLDPKTRFILECKTYNGNIRYDEDSGTYNYPESWKAQVMLALGIIGCDLGYIAWLDASMKVNYEKIEFDQGYYDAICAVMDSYWELFCKGIEPSITTADDVVRKFPKEKEDKTIQLTDVFLDKIATIQLNNEKIAELKEKTEELKGELKMLMEDAESATDFDNNVRCTFKASHTFDEERLKKEEPETYLKYCKTESVFDREAFKKCEGAKADKKYCTKLGNRTLRIK